MSASGLPFDDIRALCAMLPPPDGDAMEQVRARNLQLSKPPGSLGRLEDLAVWLAGWQGNARPAVTRPLLAIFAGNHGVTAQGVSPWPQAMTADIVANFAAGGAAANQICAVGDIGLKVFELALPVPTGDITTGPAMDERDCAATIAFGMEAIAGGADIICVGGVGVGNRTIAAAMLTALLGGKAGDWLVSEPGDGEAHTRALAAIDKALALHRAATTDPLEVLRQLGGREFAAVFGAILAARLQRIPVVLSGIVTLAAAAVVFRMGQGALDHCIAGHATSAPAHARALKALGLVPVVSTEISLEDGSGAALAVGQLRAAVACHVEMATSEQAGLSGLLN